MTSLTQRNRTAPAAADKQLADIEPGFRRARAIWSGNGLAGCEFIDPIPSGAVSAFRHDALRPGSSVSVWIGHLDEDTTADERLPGSTRALIVLAAAVAAWIPLLAIAFATFG